MNKILILTSYMSGNGGVEKVIEKMNNILSEDIVTLSLSDGKYKQGKFLSKAQSFLNWIPSGRGFYVRLKFDNRHINYVFHALCTAFFIFRVKPVAIFATGPNQILYLKMINYFLRKKIKIFGWPHFSKVSDYGNFNNFKKSDFVLCISKGILEELSTMGFDRSKLLYFPNPFLRQERTISNRSNSLLYIGRLQFEGQKNLKELLDAMKLVSSNVNVKIIGDGDGYEALIDYIGKNKLKDKVSIQKGWLSQPWDEIKSARALILTSKFEGLPTVIGEALSYGVIVISSDCPTGPSDLVFNGINGFLYEPGNIDDLVEKIDNIFDENCYLSQDKVKGSIEGLYEDNYISRFNNEVLRRI